MATRTIAVKVSPDGRITLPKRIRELLRLKPGSEVLLYEGPRSVVLAGQKLSAEELQELDLMQWSMDIDEKIRRRNEELLRTGILTQEEFL
jgi:AbrB family looped-hinge helix DNA binding protein